MEPDYPWVSSPVIIGAPMRQLALASLAVEISAAGGLGFIGAGDNLGDLDHYLQHALKLINEHSDPMLREYYSRTGSLPIGFGFFNWADTSLLDQMIEAVKKWKPAAVWQFGAHTNQDYAFWTRKIRDANEGTKVWVQVGNVADAVEVAKLARPDVLVVQGTDAGGHGLLSGAGIVSQLPEVTDALEKERLNGVRLVAAGGIVESRGVAAALVLGAHGVCLGTRFLACEEVAISNGYRDEVVRASDGGKNTLRTSLYDQLRGTTDWPATYNARGVLNKSHRDHLEGMTIEENKAFYDEAVKSGDESWGIDGRMTTYAGTGVGLVKSVMKARDIVKELQSGAVKVIEGIGGKFGR